MDETICMEAAVSNDWFDFLIQQGELGNLTGEMDCMTPVNDRYSVLYYPRDGMAEVNFGTYSYSAVPKCFTTLSVNALDASGILRIRNQPNLSLTGEGVLLGIVDSGIDYTSEAFRFEDGSSRIVSVWDQTVQTGSPPEGFFYGTVYTRQQLDEALQSDHPQSVIPLNDPVGHGTAVASIAAGSINEQNGWSGAAPYAELAVVKLKEAKQYLREFYFIADDVPAYQENDIMLAIAYLNRLAIERNQPLVLLVALGTNNGSHGGNSFLSNYLDEIAQRRGRAVLVAAGNEANARHHYYGSIVDENATDEVEINVERDMDGFFVELWSAEPELYEVAVIAPSGERLSRIPAERSGRREYTFVFEGTTLSVDYRIVGTRSVNQLIFLRFVRPTRGIWKILVYPKNLVFGHFHMWLPISAFLSGPVYFLTSNPDTTLTIPATARVPMTVGGYNDANGSLFLDSGRGFTVTGAIKPDFVAPAVNVISESGEDWTGTSFAAAIAAGASAMYLEWAVVRGNVPGTTSVDVKNEFIRGAARSQGILYPNREWGYGKLDISQTFRNLAGLGQSRLQ